MYSDPNHPLAKLKDEDLHDIYLAKIVRFCAAQQEGDEKLADEIAEDLDYIWKRLGDELSNGPERIFNLAKQWIKR